MKVSLLEQIVPYFIMVIRALQQRHISGLGSEIGGHIGDAKILAQNFQNCTFNFISRAGNSVAHAMARERSFLFEDCTWVEEAPASVESAAAEDRRWIDPP
ncbi:hypothetical protein V6N12_071412 [Hibiscus sabdariffa]|uniref:RNase H type-1 domain-containing protein n=1 Tax=Hibiscus sabdariffa TaxID=183260 RepID=A0ABR2FJP6_9ROSI